MREVRHSALVNSPPERLFTLIEDVERYPEFVPWCTDARVVSRSEGEVLASLTVRRGALRASFTTRNVLEPHRRIVMELVEGPFRELSGEWLLTPIGDAGCRVELSLQFEFANPLSAALFDPLFSATAVGLVDAFVARARKLGT